MIEGSANPKVVSKLRYGMVGGGKGAFIGDVHRKSIALDGLAELVAGSFSQNFENTLETGASLGLSRDRLYATYEEMAEKEAARPDGIDFVSIVTPNALHYPVAKAFLKRGHPCRLRQTPHLRGSRGQGDWASWRRRRASFSG